MNRGTFNALIDGRANPGRHGTERPMSGRTYDCNNGAIEYELRCDGCGRVFQCHDDSYYSWPVLCAAAEAEGWLVSPGFDGGHECFGCGSPRGVLVASAA